MSQQYDRLYLTLVQTIATLKGEQTPSETTKDNAMDLADRAVEAIAWRYRVKTLKPNQPLFF